MKYINNDNEQIKSQRSLKNIIVFRDNDSLKILDVWKVHLKGLWR